MSEPKFQNPDIDKMAQDYNANGVDINSKEGRAQQTKEALAQVEAEMAAERDSLDAPADTEGAEAAAEEARIMKAVSSLGADATRDIQLALEKKNPAGMKAAAEKMINAAIMEGATHEEAVDALQAQLKAYHDTYREAAKAGLTGMEEKAAELDAFGRSLEQSETVGTDAGKAFIAKLKSGQIGSMEQAMTALEQVKTDALKAGVSEETLNAEFNQLYKAASDVFEGGPKQKLDFGDDDMDQLFGKTGS